MNKLDDNTRNSDVFDHPMRLKLYLYLKNKKSPVGIRETQRALGIASASTVSWHFEKLLEQGYIIKTKGNQYIVDTDKKLDDNISVQVSFTVGFFRNRLVTPLTFIFYFMITMIILTFFIWIQIRDPLFIGLQGFISIIVATAVVFYIWKQVRAEIRELETSE